MSITKKLRFLEIKMSILDYRLQLKRN